MKVLKNKLYEEIINDFNKNKELYMFYLSPIIFKIKTKDFSNYNHSLFSKIKNKELTPFKNYKLNKYLKKDYEKDLKTIIKIIFKSDYIDKNNKYALFHIKKLLNNNTKLCYINLIYRLLTDTNKIYGGAYFPTKEELRKRYTQNLNTARTNITEFAKSFSDKLKASFTTQPREQQEQQELKQQEQPLQQQQEQPQQEQEQEQQEQQPLQQQQEQPQQEQEQQYTLQEIFNYYNYNNKNEFIDFTKTNNLMQSNGIINKKKFDMYIVYLTNKNYESNNIYIILMNLVIMLIIYKFITFFNIKFTRDIIINIIQQIYNKFNNNFIMKLNDNKLIYDLIYKVYDINLKNYDNVENDYIIISYNEYINFKQNIDNIELHFKTYIQRYFKSSFTSIESTRGVTINVNDVNTIYLYLYIYFNLNNIILDNINDTNFNYYCIIVKYLKIKIYTYTYIIDYLNEKQKKQEEDIQTTNLKQDMELAHNVLTKILVYIQSNHDEDLNIDITGHEALNTNITNITNILQFTGGNSKLANDKLELLLSDIYKHIKVI
jgi:hypothetical protein